MRQIDHCAPLKRPHGVPTVASVAASCLAFLFFTGPARAQLEGYFQFEPPYVNSPMGVPLAGQDGWYTVGPPGGGEWKVYSNGNNVLGVPNNTAGLTGFAGVVIDPNAPGFPEPVAIQRNQQFGLDLYFTIDIMVDHTGPAPKSRDIGRISFEPEEFSASLALIPTWVDPGNPTEWTLDVVHYTTEGEQERSSVTVPSLYPQAGLWYEIHIVAVMDTREIKSIGVIRKPDGLVLPGPFIDWYLGPWPALPNAVRVVANANAQHGTTLAFDNVFFGGSLFICYNDCDRNGPLDFFDFLCFLNLYHAGDPYADCDGSGTHDFFDFICFQNMFASGCGP